MSLHSPVQQTYGHRPRAETHSPAESHQFHYGGGFATTSKGQEEHPGGVPKGRCMLDASSGLGSDLPLASEISTGPIRTATELKGYPVLQKPLAQRPVHLVTYKWGPTWPLKQLYPAKQTIPTSPA